MDVCGFDYFVPFCILQFDVTAEIVCVLLPFDHRAVFLEVASHLRIIQYPRNCAIENVYYLLRRFRGSPGPEPSVQLVTRKSLLRRGHEFPCASSP